MPVRRSRILLVGIPLGVVVAAGVVAAVVWLSSPERRLFTSADGTRFGVQFPGWASREWIRVGASDVQAWVYRKGDTEYAAWTVKFTDAELDALPAHTLSRYLNQAVNRVGGGISSEGGEYEGLPMESTDGPATYRPTGAPSAEWGSARVVLCGDTGYVLRVFGTGARPTAPHVAAFFGSLHIPDRPHLPTPTQDDEDLKPVAKFDPTSAVAFAPASAALFAVSIPGGDETTLRDKRSPYPLGVPPPGVLKRYTYPAFAPDGTWPVAAAGYRLLADEPRQRLILAAHVEGDPDDTAGSPRPFADLHVYDLTKLPADQRLAKPAKVIKLGGHVTHLSLTPDGKHLLTLVTTPAADRDSWVKDEAQSKFYGRPHWVRGPRLTRRSSASLLRFDAATLEPAGELSLHPNSDSLTRVPGSATYYAAATVSGHAAAKPEGELQEIDTAQFRITRRHRVPLSPWHVAASADGKLLVTGASAPDQSLAVVDLTRPDAPRVRRVGGVGAGHRLVLSPDGKRVYATRDGVEGIRCWDADQLISHRRRCEIGDTGWRPGGVKETGRPVRQADEVRGLAAISPDGRFAAATSGHILRLSGADTP